MSENFPQLKLFEKIYYQNEQDNKERF